jgi:hypothetical protein
MADSKIPTKVLKTRENLKDVKLAQTTCQKFFISQSIAIACNMSTVTMEGVSSRDLVSRGDRSCVLKTSLVIGQPWQWGGGVS